MNEDIEKETSVEKNGNGVTGFDPMTGKLITDSKPKVNISKKLIGSVAVAVVAVFAVISIVSGGAFVGKSNKILLAIANTAKEQTELEKAVIKGADIITADEFTADFVFDMQQVHLDGQFVSGKKEKQLNGSVESIGISDFDFTSSLTDTTLKAQIPSLADKVYTYNYKNEKTGYIKDVASKESIEMFDQFLSSVYSLGGQKEIKKQVGDIYLDEFRSLKFEKADAKKYQIDGKERSCKGYLTTIKQDNVLNVVDELEGVFEEQYGSLYDTSMKDEFKDFRSSVKNNFEDIDVEFYLYKGKLAAINFQSSYTDCEIKLQGGKIRSSNIIATVDDVDVFELKMDENGSKEVYTITADYSSVILDYDTKTGEYKLSDVDGYSPEFEGILGETKDGFEMSTADDGGTVEYKIVLNKRAELEKFTGDEFDVGEASEGEFKALTDLINNMSEF